MIMGTMQRADLIKAVSYRIWEGVLHRSERVSDQELLADALYLAELLNPAIAYPQRVDVCSCGAQQLTHRTPTR